MENRIRRVDAALTISPPTLHFRTLQIDLHLKMGRQRANESPGEDSDWLKLSYVLRFYFLQSQNRRLKEKWHLMKICSYLSYTSERIDRYFTLAYVCLYFYETEKCLERCVQNCWSISLRNGAREAESEGLRLYTSYTPGAFPRVYFNTEERKHM